MGSALGFLLLALGLGKRMYQFNVSTVAQLFEVVYQSIGLKRIASMLSIISLFMIFVGQVLASKKFLIGIGFDQNLLFAAFWSIVVVYTVMGGLQAVVATDIVQASFFILVFTCSFFFALRSDTYELSTLVSNGLDQTAFFFDSEKFCGWLLMPLLFMAIEQDMGQRCFAAKSGKTVSLAAASAAILLLTICLIPIFFGIIGKTSELTVENGGSILMAVATKTTNPIFAALIGSAIIAAIISTADSLINAISSNVIQDFNLGFKGQQVLASRLITVIIAVAGFVVSSYFNNIVDILILSYELSISCLFVSVFAAMIRRKGTMLSAALSMALGGLGFILFRAYPIILPKEIASLILSSVGFVVGELIARVLKAEPTQQIDIS
jgi:SSS family solute:Na+ symporter